MGCDDVGCNDMGWCMGCNDVGCNDVGCDDVGCNDVGWYMGFGDVGCNDVGWCDLMAFESDPFGWQDLTSLGSSGSFSKVCRATIAT